MITGIKLPVAPDMRGKTIEDILSDIDVLAERLPESSFINSRNVTITKRSYYGKKYVTFIIDYSKEDEASFEVTYKLYETINNALPEFISCFKYSNKKIVIAYPNFSKNYIGMNEVYENMMGEIQRLAVFLMKLYGDDPAILKEMLRDYVDLCIDYPKQY